MSMPKPEGRSCLSPNKSYIPIRDEAVSWVRVNTRYLAKCWLINGYYLVLVILLSLIQFLVNLNLTLDRT
jgi:hypothetical protein